MPPSYVMTHNAVYMPQCIISGNIVGRHMKPYQLIAALMHKANLRTLRLAKLIGQPDAQPKLHRFVRGGTAEPARATAEPLANYFGIPVDAIYSEQVATTLAKQRGLSVVDWPPAQKRPASALDADEKAELNNARKALAKLSIEQLSSLLTVSPEGLVSVVEVDQSNEARKARSKRSAASDPAVASASRARPKAPK